MTRGGAMEMILHHFEGNREAHLWMPHPYGEEKKTVHHPGEGKLREHLAGRCRIGFFPFAKDDQVKWGVIDIDTGEKKDLEAVCRVLNSLNFQGQYDVETSKQKGWHIWLFCDLIPARKVRHLLLWVLQKAGVSCEVFPKQDEPATTGNGVWLPLCGYWSNRSNGRTRFVDLEGNLVDQGEVLLDIRPINESELDDLIDLHGIPEPTETTGVEGAPSGAEIVRAMAGGLRKHEGRDNAAYTITRRLAAKGFSKEEALTYLQVWDRTNIPPLRETDGPDILQKKINSAYQRQTRKGSSSPPPPIGNKEQEEELILAPRGAADLIQNAPEVVWLVEGVVPVGRSLLLTGPSGTGKSWMSLDLALAVDRGGRGWGNSPAEKGRCWLWMRRTAIPC